jgi:hypothetical protein
LAKYRLFTRATGLTPARRLRPIRSNASTDTRLEREPFQIVRDLRAYLQAKDLRIQSDGTIFDMAAPLNAQRKSDTHAYVGRRRLDRRNLLDEFLLDAKEQGREIKRSDARMGLDFVFRTYRAKRREEISLRMVDQRPQDPDREAAEWTKVAAVFADLPIVATAFLKHGIWQIKRKVIGLAPDYHLMLVIFSEHQGTGKTTFMDRFLRAGLEELLPPPILLSELVDARSGGMFEFPALILDEIHRIEGKQIDDLKQIMTANRLSRRRLFTHDMHMLEQSSTLFATTNKPIASIIPDPTGHRRFFTLTMLSGQVADGGDRSIWDLVNSIDFEMLWNSVDAWGPCPIQEHVHLLFSNRQSKDVLREWLVGLDLQSEAFLSICERQGTRPQKLRELFNEQTQSAITETAFGSRMNTLTCDPDVPFIKEKKAGIFHYKLKPSHAELHERMFVRPVSGADLHDIGQQA